MAKAIAAFYGTNSYGKKVEVAFRADDNQAFLREFGWNGYQNSWSKWEASSVKFSHPEKIAYGVEAGGAPEHFELSKEEGSKYLEFGFNLLKSYEGKLTFRLPNVV